MEWRDLRAWFCHSKEDATMHLEITTLDISYLPTQKTA